MNYYLVRDEDRSWLPVLSVPVNVTDLYSIHMYLQMIEDEARKQAAAQAGFRAADLDELGPTTRRLVGASKTLSRNNPRLAATAKKLIHLLRVA